MIAIKIFMVLNVLGLVAWFILIIIGAFIKPKGRCDITINPAPPEEPVHHQEVKIIPPTELKKEDLCLTKDLINILL